MLISFSGFDGSGKTTQIQLLLKYFKSHGNNCCSIYDINPTIRYHDISDLKNIYQYFQNYDVIHARFRLNSDANNKIMNILEYSNIPNVKLAKLAASQGYDDYTELYYYVIQPLLDANKIIISDRHYYDEIAFKTLYGCNYNDMIRLYSNVIQPSYAFYIEIDSHMAMQRNFCRPDGRTTLYRSINHIEKLKSIFDNLSSTTNLVTINGNRPVDVIHSDIIRILTPVN